MYITGTYYDLETRIHNNILSQADYNSYILDACSNKLVVSEHFLRKWVNELNKKATILGLLPLDYMFILDDGCNLVTDNLLLQDGANFLLQDGGLLLFQTV